METSSWVSLTHAFRSCPELYYDRGNHHEFAQQLVVVSTPGTITGSKQFEFDFDAIKPYETYNGVNVRCRYVVNACNAQRRVASHIRRHQVLCASHCRAQLQLQHYQGARFLGPEPSKGGRGCIVVF